MQQIFEGLFTALVMFSVACVSFGVKFTNVDWIWSRINEF